MAERCLPTWEMAAARKRGWRVIYKKSEAGKPRTVVIGPGGGTVTMYGRISKSCALARVFVPNFDAWDR